MLEILDKNDVELALTTWNSWYPKPDSLRFPDPSASPEFVDLLAARLKIVAVSRQNRPSTTTNDDAGDIASVLLLYNQYRLVHEDRVKAGRDLMNSLASSTWGSKSSSRTFLFSLLLMHT